MRPVLPSWDGPDDDPARIIRVIDEWTAEETLARLVATFPSDGFTTLDELDVIAATHWDFRGGRERNLASPAVLTDEQIAAVEEAAPALGLRGIHAPRRRHYDTVIMTGGMVRAGITKPRFVAGLLARGLSVTHVVFLGARRSFAGDEFALARALGVPGDDEVDAMRHGMTQAFSIPSNTVVEGGGEHDSWSAWSSERWRVEAATLEVLAAPSSDPRNRRAHTADTYAFWLDRHRPSPGHRVLIVTGPVYVPYQNAGAVHLLGLGAGLAVETVGLDEAALDLGPHTQPFTAVHHLQELRAAIGALRALRRAAVSAVSAGKAPSATSSASATSESSEADSPSASLG